MTKAMRAKVLAKISQVFPDRGAGELLAILDRYGTETHEQERDRVQLAVLKLCDEGGCDNPADQVKMAKQDFSDVLAWAESPNLMRRTVARDPKHRERLKRRDEAQYQAWLDKP